LYPQQTLVQTIRENEFGSEPNNETFFHTPNTTGMDGGSNSRKTLKKRLEWPTPNTLEGLAPKKLDRIMEYNNKSRPGRSYASMNLREQVVYGKIPIWPTPTSSEHKYRLQGESQASKCLEAQARRGELEEGSGGTLNPNWVEWLMGWPPGWSDLKPLEMDKFQKWQEQHGVCLNKNL
jgi:DNA (cytosine-5)-methyltransferase 1